MSQAGDQCEADVGPLGQVGALLSKWGPLSQAGAHVRQMGAPWTMWGPPLGGPSEQVGAT